MSYYAVMFSPMLEVELGSWFFKVSMTESLSFSILGISYMLFLNPISSNSFSNSYNFFSFFSNSSILSLNAFKSFSFVLNENILFLAASIYYTNYFFSSWYEGS